MAAKTVFNETVKSFTYIKPQQDKTSNFFKQLYF